MPGGGGGLKLEFAHDMNFSKQQFLWKLFLRALLLKHVYPPVNTPPPLHTLRLLYGDMLESSWNEIPLGDTPPEAFGVILEYMYSGKVGEVNLQVG